MLATSWDAPSLQPYLAAFPPEHRSSPGAVRDHVHELVARDVKAGYLKSLQGHLWRAGYEAGVLTCPLFPDVLPFIQRCSRAAAPVPVLIYSSGSVAAQKLLFAHTGGDAARGEKDLTPLLSGYFDTLSAGPKTESASYASIAATRPEDVHRWLFLSDRVEEVEAARAAGMQSAVVVREGNAALSEEEKARFTLVRSFDEIDLGE